MTTLTTTDQPEIATGLQRARAMATEVTATMHRLRSLNVEARARLRRLNATEGLEKLAEGDNGAERRMFDAIVKATDLAAGVARRSLAKGDFVWVTCEGTGTVAGPDPYHETRLIVLLDDPGEGPQRMTVGRENMYFMGPEPISDASEEWTRAYDRFVPATR